MNYPRYEDRGPISPRIFEDVKREITRAIEKHGQPNTPLNPEASHAWRHTVLSEEVGEAAKEINEMHFVNPDNTDDLRLLERKLYDELVQVAAVSVMTLRALRAKWEQEEA